MTAMLNDSLAAAATPRTEAPVLETERLILRGHRADDLNASLAMWSHPEVVAHITGKPATREECFSRILRYAGHWHLLGYGYWAVEEKASGRVVGDVGFSRWNRPMHPELDRTPEAGWALHPSVHGRGYAREAVRAAHAWADRHLPSPATVCVIVPENRPSLRVADDFGYREFARAMSGETEVMLMRRERGSSK